jgi:hypothetical protein
MRKMIRFDLQKKCLLLLFYGYFMVILWLFYCYFIVILLLFYCYFIVILLLFYKDGRLQYIGHLVISDKQRYFQMYVYADRPISLCQLAR